MRIDIMKVACVAWLVLVSASCGAQHAFSQDAEVSPMATLLVDATKTFSSTLRVAALAGAIRAAGTFDLHVCFSDESSLYRDPLGPLRERPDGVYDVVLIVPRGIDDGTVGAVWIVTNSFPWISPADWAPVDALSRLVDTVFAGLATAVDPTEDLWTSALASDYRTQGRLR